MIDPLPPIDWLERSARSAPDSVALLDDDGAVVTYSELDAIADAEAERLSASGVGRGEVRLMPVGQVNAACVGRLWGAWRFGVVPLVVDETAPDRWSDELRDLALQPAGAGSLHTVVPTSGSRGEPRAVRLTHRNVVAAVNASTERLGNSGSDRWLLTLPLFHIGGLSILWRSAAVGGAVVVHRRFDAKRAADAIRRGEITIASFVPTMLYRMLAVDPGPYDGMRALLLGGAAASRELVERALDSGLPILQTYGMTETCSQIATVTPGEEIAALGTVGRPLSGIEVATGGAGVGEIVVSGPMVSPGYLGRPDRSSGHRTGDVGYLDDNGHLVVLGRADDMIITGGENVYPGQVAHVLARHESIDQVEVVGVPDPEWGQTVVAVVVGAVKREAVELWAQEQLSRHEMPKRWAFVDAIPLLPGGKIDRVAVHEIAGQAQ